MSDLHVAVIGNPNCGKTTLFNALTGSKQRVGNWPGVTVERKDGSFISTNGKKIAIVDLPGTYSLSGVGGTSLDEKIARDYILSNSADVVINIVDASNWERNFYLTTQLLEMHVPMVVVLNMTDVATKNGIEIDCQSLSEQLGCPVLPIVASQKRGLDSLIKFIEDCVEEAPTLPKYPKYQPEVNAAIDGIGSHAEIVAKTRGIKPHWLGIKALEDDEMVMSWMPGEELENIKKIKSELEEHFKEDADIIVADNRYGFIQELGKNVVRRDETRNQTISDRIDQVVLNRFLGIPIFMVVMYLMFLFTINFASAFIDFFDIFAGTVAVDGTAHLLGAIDAPAWVTVLLANGVGGGIQTVATFIPIIGFLFLFLTFLEDSGYMSRAAFVMDRTMRAIGLPGKSFVPMILGFGCTVPAVMAARTLENKRDRIMTAMMAPFMSCGARLPVYALFAAAFFPVGGQNIVFLLYILGIVFAVITGLVLKFTLLKGEAEPFIMEMPAYHMPTIQTLITRTWHRLSAFLFKAGKMIIMVVIVLSFLNSWGTDGSFGNEDTERSVLAAIGQSITPIVEPMGIDEENWPATVGLFTGLFAKEVVVGTLDALYTQMAEEEGGSDEEEAPFSLIAGIKDAFATIPPNVADALSSFNDPLGINIGDTSTIDAASEEQEVSTSTFGTMVSRFNGKAAALAYMMIILLYMPCVAATSAILRETSKVWVGFIGLWSTGLGYGAAVITYQMGNYASHPQTSILWTVSILSIITVFVMALRYIGSPAAPAKLRDAFSL